MDQTTATMSEARASLARLGGRSDDTAIATMLSIAEWADGYLSVTRLDWPSQALGPDSADPALWLPQAVQVATPRGDFINGLLDWAQAYRALASEGYRRAVKQADLAALR
jgi:hypothetical protein